MLETLNRNTCLKQKNTTSTKLKALIAYNHRDKHLNRQVATLLFKVFQIITWKPFVQGRCWGLLFDSCEHQKLSKNHHNKMSEIWVFFESNPYSKRVRKSSFQKSGPHGTRHTKTKHQTLPCQNPWTSLTQNLLAWSIEEFGPHTSNTNFRAVNSLFSSKISWRGHCHPKKTMHLKASQCFMQRRHRSLWLRLSNESRLMHKSRKKHPNGGPFRWFVMP